MCWDSAVVPEELSPEAAALAQAEAEADGQAEGRDAAADARQRLVDPPRDGANSTSFGFCRVVTRSETSKLIKLTAQLSINFFFLGKSEASVLRGPD